MFQEDIANLLPPSALSLISYLLNSPYLTIEIYTELLDAISVLSSNCWTIYRNALTQLEQHEGEGNSAEQPSLEEIWMPVLRLVCDQCLRDNDDLQIEALDLLEEMMCDDNIHLLSASEYNPLIAQTILPTLRQVLLRTAGIDPTSTEKARVTRMRENTTLELLVEVMVAILQVRFESLLIMEGFSTLWTQILSILQFVQTISIAEGKLQEQNKKAVIVLLKHAMDFGLFKVRFEEVI